MATDLNEEKLLELEKVLEEHGYKKWTTALSSKESYGWFHTVESPDGREEDNILVEYRVWDYREYCAPGANFPRFGLDVLMIVSGEHRTDLVIGKWVSPEEAESIATDFLSVCKKHSVLSGDDYFQLTFEKRW